MPVAQLLSSGIESLLNQLIKLDPASQGKLKKLQGKSLLVKITELPWPLLFQFSGHISVGIVQADEAQQNQTQQIQTQADHVQQNSASCRIELNLATLPLLQDSSKLTQLIQQEKLRLNGDIYVAQSFSSLLQELDIDWEEQLSVYTGDAVAHQTFQTVKSAIYHSKEELAQARIVWGERLTQQGALGIKPQELNEFSEQVNSLRSAAERLSARLAILEKNHKA